MRKTSIASAVALLFLMPAMMFSAATSAGGQDDWTVMVYIAADNNLEPFGIMNLEMLESVGSSESVNFVVLIDTLAGPASIVYVTQGGFVTLAELGEVNTADPAVMADFIKAAKQAAPAQKYAFVSWDHGGGWRGLNWDDTSSMETGTSQYTDMKELREAVASAGVRFDVFAFDQCLMAQPEVAYQIRGYADYAVFSEETIYGQGFPYDAIAGHLVADPAMGAEALSKVIVADFAVYYNSITWANDWTISAFDMAYMDDLTTAVSDLATTSMNALWAYKSQLKNDLSGTLNYYYPYFVDLKGYAMNVASDKAILDGALKAAAQDVVDAIDDGIVSMLNSKHNIDSYGISIYFPNYRSSYLGLKAAYSDVPFAVDTDWLLFLQSTPTGCCFSGRSRPTSDRALDSVWRGPEDPFETIYRPFSTGGTSEASHRNTNLGILASRMIELTMDTRSFDDAETDSSAVSVRSLVKRYGQILAVNDISFQIPKGEIFAFLGPNGAGKTTTVEILECLRKPTEGDAWVLGHNVAKEQKHIRRIIGVLPQEFNTYDRLTVKENIEYFGRMYGRALDSKDLIRIVGLEDKTNSLFMHLSGGQKQKLGVAIALVNDPDMVFLDEPSSGLDPKARRDIWEAIKALRDKGKTVFLTTHYMEEAEVLADRVGVINKGRIVAMGSPDELIRKYGAATRLVIKSPTGNAKDVLCKRSDCAVRSSNGDIEISLGSKSLLPEIIMDLEKNHVGYAELLLKRASLEDVFLNLTGEELGRSD